MDLGTQLRARRKALGLTMEEVAFTAGVNRRIVGELEGGKHAARFDIVVRVAEALGLQLQLVERT